MTVTHSGPTHRVPALFAPFDTLIAAESTRHGGISPAPFQSLNLGINTTDDPAHVDENRRRFFEAIGAADVGFASSLQVHGTAVLHAVEAGRYAGYDALITNRPGLLIGVTVADCVPILVYDARRRAVGAAHAGWRGTAGRIVSRMLDAMQQQFGTSAGDCYAYVGTCIDERSFEVGPEVADQFEDVHKLVKADSQRVCVNLQAANVKLLIDAGVPVGQISVSPYSTVLNNSDYFSHRAEQGQTGRMLAVIGLKP